MPTKKRFKTDYSGVFFIEGVAVATGQPERIYYMRYRRDGKMIDEKAGRQYQHDMTPARASRILSQRIDGNQLSNQAKIK